MNKKVELFYKPTGDCQLLIDGVNVANKAFKVEVTVEAGKLPVIGVFYHAVEFITLIDGWVQTEVLKSKINV